MESENTEPTWRERVLGVVRSIPFPVGLGVIAFGVGIISFPAGVIAAGAVIALIGWAVE